MTDKDKHDSKKGHQLGHKPEAIDDPLADSIDWTPANPGGASFKTTDLKVLSAECIAIVPSAKYRRFFGLFASVPSIMLLGFALEGNLEWPVFLALSPFILIPAWLYCAHERHRFDKTQNQHVQQRGVLGFLQAFWGKRLWESTNVAPLPLNDIYALQIIGEWLQSNSENHNGSYQSFELNAITQSGRRIPLIDHGDIQALRADAETLAAFLAVPVWDAVLQ